MIESFQGVVVGEQGSKIRQPLPFVFGPAWRGKC